MKASPLVEYGKVIEYVDIARSAGVKVVAVVLPGYPLAGCVDWMFSKEDHIDDPLKPRGRMGISVGRTGSSVMSDTNVTPMIDVLLVLLVIFILVQMNLQRSFDLQLPYDADGPPPNQAIVMEISAAGNVLINTKPVPAVALNVYLHRIYDGRPDKLIFVKASPDVDYGRVIEYIDIARGAGVKVVGVVLTPALASIGR